jgi:predicted nucleic acid-binding protein
LTTARRAVLDTNVLFPPTLRDTLPYAADAGIFEPFWSAETLSQLQRNLALKAGMSEVSANRRTHHMTLAFPSATVNAVLDGVPRLPDARDRHVLAAALKVNATVIVSSNVKDFPEAALTPVGISLYTPDQFLCGLFRERGQALADAIRFHADLLRHPPTTVTGLLRTLSSHAPTFVRSIIESGLFDR